MVKLSKKHPSQLEHEHPTVSMDTDKRLLITALVILSLFMASEFTLGLLAHSLALMTDAAHMLTDAASIFLVIVAINYAKRPADAHYTYGWQRVQILSAQINGITLLILAVVFIKEAISRLINGGSPNGKIIFFTALAGIFINLIVTLILSKANRDSLNIRGAYLHILTDLYAFIGTTLAGLVILIFKWPYADIIASLIVAYLMLSAGWRLTKQATVIFLEAVPKDISTPQVAAELLKIPGVKQIHDLHIWSISSNQVSLSAHILVDKDSSCHSVAKQAKEILQNKFAIKHVTLQLDHLAKKSSTSGNEFTCATGSHGEVYSK